MESPRPSHQAKAEDDPSVGAEASAEGSTPRRSTWTLVLGGTSLSGARRSSAFQLARCTLDGLEVQLALEEAEINRVRDELERARVRLTDTVERCHHHNEAACAPHEEALCFAKEVRESAAR